MWENCPLYIFFIVPQIYTITIEHTHKGRLDQVILQAFSDLCPDLSRTRFQSLMRSGALSHEGVAILKNQNAIPAGVYTLSIDDPTPSHIEPVDMDLDIIFEDDDVIIVNKPVGMTVHPGAGTKEPTLVHGLLHRFKGRLSGVGGVERPGIVHRLDKDTSGLMVVAKNDFAHQNLSKQFETRSLSRTYYAFVWGLPNPLSGCVHTSIGRHPQNRQKMKAFDRKIGDALKDFPDLKDSPHRKEAITLYKTLRTQALTAAAIYSKVECTLKTGRTHQIRVHMQHIGCPVVGDPIYGRVRLPKFLPDDFYALPRQALHAAKLSFIHPRSEEPVSFECDLPQDLQFLDDALDNTLDESFDHDPAHE